MVDDSSGGVKIIGESIHYFLVHALLTFLSLVQHWVCYWMNQYYEAGREHFYDWRHLLIQQISSTQKSLKHDPTPQKQAPPPSQ